MKTPAPRTPLIGSTDSYNLIIPDSVEFRIRQWCMLNPSTEWSGTLFYTVNGSFENKDIEFTVRDFFVMDIGTSGFTNYKETPEICSYMMENDLLDCKTGLIHSHNSMKAFFSGTDANTLVEEGEQTIHFLSLVVNNEGTYVARVTRRIVEEIEGTRRIKYTTYNGEEVSVIENVKTGTKEYIQYIDLNIKVNNPYADIKKFISERYNELKEAKKVTYNSPKNVDYGNRFFTPNKSEFPIMKSEVPSVDTVSKVEKKSKEPTLFSNKDFDTEETEKYIKEIAVQLLYGNILLTHDSYSKFTKADEWITTNMEKAFSRRFGKDEGGFKTFQDWLYQICDTIIYSAADEYVYEGKAAEVDTAAFVIASKVTIYLQELVLKAFKEDTIADCDVNKYIAYIFECLESFNI